MKIELDERELEIMLDALDCWRDKLRAGGNATDEVSDLAADLFESLHRADDAAPDAAAEFIPADLDVREQVKAPRRAAVANDPIDW